MRTRHGALSQRLTRRMILVQLITLATFFGLILLPVFVVPMISGVRNIHPLDPTVIGDIERTLSFDANGKLRIAPSDEIDRIKAQYPEFWFAAVAPDGTSVSSGELPSEVVDVGTALRDVVSLQVILELEDRNLGMLVRTVSLGGERVKIATGDGPTLGLSGIIQGITVFLMAATFIVLAAASAVAIPRFIRREMRGLNGAAQAAATIDVDQRGIRIPEIDLPAEVLALVHAMNAALQRLDEAHSRRERFLADAAHELRTPIAVLSARIETADPFPGQQQLLADVTRLAELSNQLLDVQRLTLSDPVLEGVDLVELGAAVVADLAPLAIAAGYELELDAPERPVLAQGEFGSLQRAVSNLVRNAISHAAGGRRIIVAIRAPAEISVSDDGVGVRPGEEQRIFEPFHRSMPSSEGAGLGLSLVQSIVDRHNGRVAVERSSVGGARFVIMLRQAA